MPTTITPTIALHRTEQMIADLASTDSGKGASLIGVYDADGHFTADTVEDVLVEMYEANGRVPSTTAAAGTSLASLGGGDVETIFNLGSYTIPASTITAGTMVHLRAVIRVTDGTSAATLQARCRLGGVAGTVLAATTAVNVATGNRGVLDVWLNGHAVPGVAAEIAWTSTVTDFGAAGTPTLIDAASRANFATSGALVLCVTGIWNGGAAGDDANIESMLVEWAG